MYKFSGPVLATFFAIFITLIPIPNVMEQPGYWYVDIMCRFFAVQPTFTSLNGIRAEYWSHFTFENRWSTYVVLYAVCSGVQISLFVGYYYIWAQYLQLSPPMPFNPHIVGSLSYIALNVTIWFR